MKLKHRGPFFLFGSFLIFIFFYLLPLDFSPAPQSTTDPYFNFILFPSHSNIQIYADPNRTQPLNQTLNRAVTATLKELDSDTVGVALNNNTLGYVSNKELTFVPPPDVNLLIEKWRLTLPFQGYTRANYSTKVVSDDQIETTLELIDDNHVRSHTYTYITKDNQLIDTKPIKLKTSMTILLKLPYFLVAEAILAIVVVTLCRKK